jgi:hypothetical protein
MAWAVASLPAGAADTPPRAFVAETAVVAPREVGDYRLVEHHFDPANKTAGVSLRYVDARQPDVPIDVFVYPAGSRDPARAVHEGMADFRSSLDQAVAKGYFTGLRIVEDGTFDVRGVPAAAPRSRSTATSLPPALEALVRPEPLRGHRLVLAFERDGQPQQSAGYLAYKQLYFLKGRITRPADAMAPSAFAEFGDAAMRTLIPAIEALNDGRCSEKTIHLDDDEKDATRRTNALLAQVGESMARGLRDGCMGPKPLEQARAATEGNVVVDIAYDASEWRAP